MKRILLFIVLAGITSCNEFQTEKLTSEEILTLERKQLNWHEVDQYPAFKNCREITEAEAAKACFEEKVTRYVYAHLSQKRPVVTQNVNDTIWLQLVISEEGVPAIDSVEMDSLVIKQLPNIKLWLTESIDSLPKIFPAIKRGIPVSTKFKMPIVIRAR
ncbi:MAG TPA: hypothetical protein VFI78_01575 [Salinimicrobium sp.]|nr:hypothetical protein [Salinimicrobium sp.]